MTDPGDSYTKPILESLKDVRQQTGHGWSHVFSDWIDIAFATLQHDDDSYGEMVDRYENDFGKDTTRSVFEGYSEAFAHLLEAMGKTDVDVLGHLYQENGAPSSESGQYFTPPAAAQLLGGLTAPSSKEIQNATHDDPLAIHDPACGPPQFMVSSNDETTDSSSEAAAMKDANGAREQQIQVETNIELDAQQVNFAAFADDSDQ